MPTNKAAKHGRHGTTGHTSCIGTSTGPQDRFASFVSNTGCPAGKLSYCCCLLSLPRFRMFTSPGLKRTAAVQCCIAQFWYQQSCPRGSCMMQHGSKTSFNAFLASEPGLHVLCRLSEQDLLRLASTCHFCKDAVSFATLPKAKDVSEAQESAPIPCRFTLADLAALLEPLRGPAQVSLGQACRW